MGSRDKAPENFGYFAFWISSKHCSHGSATMNGDKSLYQKSTLLRVWESKFAIPNWYTSFKIALDMALNILKYLSCIKIAYNNNNNNNKKIRLGGKTTLLVYFALQLFNISSKFHEIWWFFLKFIWDSYSEVVFFFKIRTGFYGVSTFSQPGVILFVCLLLENE